MSIRKRTTEEIQKSGAGVLAVSWCSEFCKWAHFAFEIPNKVDASSSVDIFPNFSLQFPDAVKHNTRVVHNSVDYTCIFTAHDTKRCVRATCLNVPLVLRKLLVQVKVLHLAVNQSPSSSAAVCYFGLHAPARYWAFLDALSLVSCRFSLFSGSRSSARSSYCEVITPRCGSLFTPPEIFSHESLTAQQHSSSTAMPRCPDSHSLSTGKHIH